MKVPESTPAREGHRPEAGHEGGNQFGPYTVRYPSEKQVKFATRLLETRDLSAMTDDQAVHAAGILAGTTNLRHTSDLITWLLAQPELKRPAAAATPGFVSNPASEKQVGFIRKLANERVLPDGREGETVMDVLGGKQVSKREASDAITALLAAPEVDKRVAAQTTAEIEVGVYRTADGVIHRAYYGQQSGRILCKRLDPEATSRSGRWTYEGMASRFVTPADRMTLEEAKEFGRHYALCCVCGADLDDPNSVEAGIGPVCGGRV